MAFRNAPTLWGWVALALLGPSSHAIASTSTTVVLSNAAEQSLYLPATGTYDSFRDSTSGELRQDQSDPGGASTSSSILDLRTAGLATVSASGSATAAIAGLRVSALVTGGASAANGLDGAAVFGTVAASGSIYDEFVLVAPGLAPGALLDLTGSIYTDATTRNIGTATSAGVFDTAIEWQSTFYLEQVGGVANAFALQDQRCRFGTSIEQICSGSGPASGELKLLVPNGATLALQIAGRASATGSAGAQGPAGNASVQAGADLGSTIAWAGITSLKDANGNPIASFSAVSATSGFDYRQGYVSAVPLPPTVALLATALAGTGGLLARRRRRAPAPV